MMRSIILISGMLLLSSPSFLGCIKQTAKPNVNEIAEGCAGVEYQDWEASEYILPFQVGKSHAIGLSHCSGSYHGLGLPDQFAIDFNMETGTQIIASRDGEVVHVEESGFDGAFPNNLVVIEHIDGTFLQYMHLTHNGAEVRIGQKVVQGQLIGFSGSTGLAGYPHLHLVATTPGSWEYPYTSFPTTFSNTKENTLSLKSGEIYKAFPF